MHVHLSRDSAVLHWRGPFSPKKRLHRLGFLDAQLAEASAEDVELLRKAFGRRQSFWLFVFYAATMPPAVLIANGVSEDPEPFAAAAVAAAAIALVLVPLYLLVRGLATRWGNPERELLYAVRDVLTAASAAHISGLERRRRERTALRRLDRHAARLAVPASATRPMMQAAGGDDHEALAGEMRLFAVAVATGSAVTAEPQRRLAWPDRRLALRIAWGWAARAAGTVIAVMPVAASAVGIGVALGWIGAGTV